MGEIAADLVAGRRTSLVLIGRGGSGKSVIVGDVLDQARAAGLATKRIDGRRLDNVDPYSALEDVVSLDALQPLLDDPSRLDRIAARRELVDAVTPGLLVIDDAQWIDPETLTMLAAAAGSVGEDGFRMLLAHRPRMSQRELAALDGVLSRHHQPEVLHALDHEHALKQLANSAVGDLGDEIVDRVAARTAGSPSLLTTIVEAAEVDPLSFAEWCDGSACPAAVVESIRGRIGHLSAEARELLLAFSYGASPTDAEIGDLVSIGGEGSLAGALDELDDEGLLVSDGSDVIPLVAEAATQLQAPQERRRHHARFARVLHERGGSAVSRAEHLRESGAAPRELAAADIAAADELLRDVPRLALTWLDSAADSGVSDTDLAARRVEALVRDGQPIEALRAAQPLFRSGAPDRLTGLGHVATAFVQSRRPLQAASVLEQLAPRLDGDAARLARLSAATCLALGGNAEQAFASVDAIDTDSATDPAVEIMRLLLESLHELLSADADRAVASAIEASELELTAVADQQSPVGAADVAPFVAMFAGDVLLARRLAKRALRAPAVTDVARQGRILRSGLLEMWAGRTDAGADATADWPSLSPRNRLLACALHAGTARRSNELGQLRAVRDRALEVLLLPPDLVSLHAYGEVMVAVARLGDVDRVREARALRDRALGELTNPAVDACTCWTDLQVALVSDTSEDVPPIRERIEDLAGRSTRMEKLISAMTTWCDVIDKRAEPDEIMAAGRDLSDIGLQWEAARLVGAAALRVDESAAKTLLAAARELRSSSGRDADDEAPLSARLSARELEVAELLIGGNSYKVIGGRLFISPKTVEHHVARIRQRLGATSRAEMLDVLRTELA